MHVQVLLSCSIQFLCQMFVIKELNEIQYFVAEKSLMPSKISWFRDILRSSVNGFLRRSLILHHGMCLFYTQVSPSSVLK